MARKKQEEEPENHERWLVSYADFITLLFAFFVMMFANAQVEQSRMQQIAEGFEKAIDPKRISRAIAKITGRPAEQIPASVKVKEQVKVVDLQTKELQPSLELLTGTLASEIAQGRVDIHLERRGLIISLKEAAFYPPGGAIVEPSAYPALERIAVAVRNLPNPLRLEGHTDSVPISTPRFRNNWELSTARAINLLELFTGKMNIETTRMAVAGFADTAPVADNKTEDGRARNRRVDIVILNQTGLKSEPVQTPSTAR